MTLSSNHSMQLIKDILNAHYGDGAATQSEFEQLYRTTNVMMNTGQYSDISNTIQEINGYSATAMTLDGYDNHLNDNMGNISAWIKDLE